MTVGELIDLLGEFPPELPVFFQPDPPARRVSAPRDAILDLVHPGRAEVLPDGTTGPIPPGYVDALVVSPTVVREPAD